MFISLYRATKFAWQNFRRNLWLSIVTIFILILTLFTISLLAAVNLTARQVVQAIKEKVDIDIFFNQQTSEADILAAQTFLKDLEPVKDVKYVSKEMALEQFRALHAQDIDIQNSLEELDENPLPASLVIQAKELDDYQEIINQFENSEYNSLVQSKDFTNHRVLIDRINLVIKRIYQVGLGLSAVFILISIIVVFNTVRLTIYAHREEIGIMKLVGATNWFIRGPLLMEGVLYAFISSLVTMLIIYPLIFASSPYINNLFTGYNFDLLDFANQYLWQIITLQFLISLLLSLASTSLAISRHLDV